MRQIHSTSSQLVNRLLPWPVTTSRSVEDADKCDRNVISNKALQSRSVLCGENPVAARLQSDNIAAVKFPIPGRVDLDHGGAFARAQSDFRALDRAERSD